jgi:hypothetical protein
VYWKIQQHHQQHQTLQLHHHSMMTGKLEHKMTGIVLDIPSVF